MLCQQCDEPLPVQTGRGRPRKYCSDECIIAASRIPPRVIECADCGTEIVAKRTTKEVCVGCIDKRRADKAKSKRMPEEKSCSHCAKVFATLVWNRVYCDDCAAPKGGLKHSLTDAGVAQRARGRAITAQASAVREAKREKTLVNREAMTLRRWGRRSWPEPTMYIVEIPQERDVECHGCGQSFTTEHKTKKYCTQECRTIAGKKRSELRRRAAMKVEYAEVVDPIAVFNRDGWRCKLCQVDTPRTQRGSYEDTAPELDHIYPLSKGGEHSYENTWLLCRSCNNIKSDRVLHFELLGLSGRLSDTET